MTTPTDQLLALIPRTHDFNPKTCRTYNSQTYAWLQDRCFYKETSLKGFSAQFHLDTSCTCDFNNPKGFDTLVLTKAEKNSDQSQWSNTPEYTWVEVKNPPLDPYPPQTDDAGGSDTGEADDDGSKYVGSDIEETYDDKYLLPLFSPQNKPNTKSTCNRSLALTILAVIGVAGVVFGALGLTQVMSMSTALAGSLTGVGGALVLAKLLDTTVACCNQEPYYPHNDTL